MGLGVRQVYGVLGACSVIDQCNGPEGTVGLGRCVVCQVSAS